MRQSATVDEQSPHLYSAQEWAAMTEHERALLREDRRRMVELERARHQERQRLLDELTAERFGHAR
jgi:hypothetical protein